MAEEVVYSEGELIVGSSGRRISIADLSGGGSYADLVAGKVPLSELGAGSDGSGAHYLADDQTWKSVNLNPYTASAYGVVADGVKITDAAMTAGSPTLRSASSAFTSALVGKTINVARDDRVVNDGVTNSTTALTSATAAFTTADVGCNLILSDSTADTSRASCGLTSGSATVTCATAAVADIGRNVKQTAGIAAGVTVTIIDAVANTSYTLSTPATASNTSTLTLKGYTMVSTVAAYVSATQVTMADAALYTITGSTIVIQTPPLHSTILAAPTGTTLTLADNAVISHTAATAKYGTDNGAFMATAHAAAALANTTLTYPPGRILCSAAVGSSIVVVTPATGGTANAVVVGAGKDITIFDVVARGVFTSDWGLFASANVSVATTCNWSLNDFTVEYVGPVAADVGPTNSPFALFTRSGPCEAEWNRVRITGIGQAHRQETGSGTGVRRRQHYYDCDFVTKLQVVSAFNNTVITTHASCGTTSTSAVVTDTHSIAGDVGKYVTGTGIPIGTRILSVVAGVSFTMTSAATATGTITASVYFPIDHYVRIRRAHFESTDPRGNTPTDNNNYNHILYIHGHISYDIWDWSTKAGDINNSWHLHQNGGSNEIPAMQRIIGWRATGTGTLAQCALNTGSYTYMENVIADTQFGLYAQNAALDVKSIKWSPPPAGAQSGGGLLIQAVGTNASVRIDGFRDESSTSMVTANFLGFCSVKNGDKLTGTGGSVAIMQPGASGTGEIENVTCNGTSAASSNPQYFARQANSGSRLAVRRCIIGGTWQAAAVAATTGSTGSDVVIDDNTFNTGSSVPIIDSVSTGTDGPLRGANNKFLGTVGPKVTGATRRRGNKLRVGRGVNPATIASASGLQLGMAGWTYDTHRITGTTAIDTMFLGASVDETYAVGSPITLVANDAMVINSGSAAGSFAEALAAVAGHAYTFIFDQSLATPLWVRVG